MGRTLQTLRVFLNADVSRFQRGMRTAKRQLAGFAKFAAGTTIAAGAAAGVATAGLMASSVKAYINAQETFSKFGTVFSNVTGMAEAAAKDLAQNYGLANVASKDLLASNADILSGFGFTQEKALGLSYSVVKLGADLASFTNFKGGTAGATTALTKALLGETESAKALGIVIRQDSDEFKNLVEQGQKVKGLTLLQSKAMAALTIATNQSKNAIGDFARTADDPANRLRVLHARWTDIKIVLGQITFKALDMDKGIGSVADKLSGFAENLTKNVGSWIATMRMFVNNVVSDVKLIASTLQHVFTMTKNAFTRWDDNGFTNEENKLIVAERARLYATKPDKEVPEDQRAFHKDYFGIVKKMDEFKKALIAKRSHSSLTDIIAKSEAQRLRSEKEIKDDFNSWITKQRDFTKNIKDGAKRLEKLGAKQTPDNNGLVDTAAQKAKEGYSGAVLKGSLEDYRSDIYSRKQISTPESQTAANTKKTAEKIQETLKTQKEILRLVGKFVNATTLETMVGGY